MTMQETNLEELKYPIGKFKFEGELTEELKNKYIKDYEEAPSLLRNAVEDLNEEQLNTQYRPDGWTVKQVVHHLPDSHMNSFIRFKLTLTEKQPIIKSYDEKLWAKLPDTINTPVSVSLDLFEALQKRFAALLRAVPLDDFKKTFIHPELGLVALERNIGVYAWHGKHHVAQIISLRNRMNW